MEVEQYFRNQRLLGTAGGVTPSTTSSWSELENLGETLTPTGIESEKQRLRAQYYDQINKARLEVAKRFEEFQNTLDPDSTDKWVEELEKSQRQYDDIKLTNARASADFNVILEREKFNQKKAVSDYRRVVDARNFRDNYYINKKEFMEIAARSQTPGDYQQAVLSSMKSLFGLQLKEGAKTISADNLETDKDFDNPLFQTEELRINEAMAWLKDAGQMYREVQEERIFAGAAENLKQFTDRQQAIDYIDNVLVHALSREQRNDLLAITNRRFDGIEAQAKIALDEQQGKDKQAILDRIVKKQFIADPEKGVNEDIYDFINSTSLDEDEKKEWLNWAQTRAKNEGKEIRSDVREEARLESKALDISTGSVKKEDFIREINESAFGAKPKIDEDAYESLMSIANREHKTYQANSMGEAINYGLRQLTHTEEQMNLMMFSPEFAGLSTEQKTKRILSVKRLEDERFSQYKRSLNEWFESEKSAGRDPDDDDIYVKSRKLTRLYQEIELTEDLYKGTAEERENIRSIAGYFTGPGPFKAGTFGGGGITVVENKEQFDALPAGSVFIAPDGSKNVKK